MKKVIATTATAQLVEEVTSTVIPESTTSTCEFDELGVAIWKDKENNIIGNLDRSDFINENSKKSNLNHAIREFCLYMVQVKTYRASLFDDKANTLRADAKDYAQKAADVGKVKTPAEVLLAKKAKILKQLEKANADMKALGLAVD